MRRGFLYRRFIFSFNIKEVTNFLFLPERRKHNVSITICKLLHSNMLLNTSLRMVSLLYLKILWLSTYHSK